MENFLEGGVEQLETVKSAITDLAQKEQLCKESDRSLKAKQKELELQRKRVEEKITQTIKKSRTELEKGFDEQISSAEKAIKEAELKRKNAKAAAVSLRMKMENSTMVDENKVLEAEIKAKFKEAKIPRLCRNRLYYSLFKPHRFTDFLICAAVILICAGVIPFVVTRFVNGTFIRILIWVLIAVFFAAVYLLISFLTKKGNRNEIITDLRPSMDHIADNKKFIRKRNKNIKADKDESQYNLTEYDERLQAARTEYDSVMSRKTAAVQEFENVESVRIRTEMEEERASVFEELEKEIDQMQTDLQERTESFQQATQEMGEYTEALGEKNMKPEKIDELIALFGEEEGKAKTIAEALEMRKDSK